MNAFSWMFSIHEDELRNQIYKSYTCTLHKHFIISVKPNEINCNNCAFRQNPNKSALSVEWKDNHLKFLAVGSMGQTNRMFHQR